MFYQFRVVKIMKPIAVPYSLIRRKLVSKFFFEDFLKTIFLYQKIKNNFLPLIHTIQTMLKLDV